MGSMKRTGEHTHEVRDAEKIQEIIHAVSTRLERRGYFCGIWYEPVLLWAWLPRGCGVSVTSCQPRVSEMTASLYPPHPPPPPHRMAEISDSRSRCVYPCFCKTWDTVRPGLGNTFGWACMNLGVDSLYRQLEMCGAASVGQLCIATALAFIKRNRMIRTFKDWALQTLEPDFHNPSFIFMCCIFLKDFASLSFSFPMKCKIS